jgi:hypothetical protein
MPIKSEVLKAVAKAYPNRRYKSRLNETYGNPLTRDFAHEFFRAEICPKTDIYLSEDFWFCDQARRLGFQTFVLPSARTTHTGSYEFVLDLPALASLGAAQSA